MMYKDRFLPSLHTHNFWFGGEKKKYIAKSIEAGSALLPYIHTLNEYFLVVII